MTNMWDTRFASTPDYVYGTEPNAWIASQMPKLAVGAKVLAVADGEGRNAVWLAKQGYEVLNVDYSRVGLEKSVQLACEHQVSIQTYCCDLIETVLPDHAFDALVSSFFHVPRQHQVRVWQKLWRTLKSGAPAVIQVFSVDQLGLPSGGPKDINLLYDIESISLIAENMLIDCIEQVDVELNEGLWHQGAAKVINIKLFKR
jgi:SAM-dependent methyltransferase